MTFPERFSDLPDYAFPRLRKLLAPHAPGGPLLSMSIGEPCHPFPDWIGRVIDDAAADFGRYPANDGTPELLYAAAGWLSRRFGISPDPETQLMVLNGSREGLMNATLALCPEVKAGQKPAVLVPNPFYQVYAVGALAAGAEPVYVNATAETAFLPDFAALHRETLDRTAIAFVCTPSNPQGAVADLDYLTDLLRLAEKHDFRVFSDECYSEIYEGDPPPSILQAAVQAGADPGRVVAFNSLSKRSNLPGLRVGIAAGGKSDIDAMKRLRAYAGAPVPLPLQHAAARVWADEDHVAASRALYVEKFKLARDIFGDLPDQMLPRAGFFLWLGVDDGEAAAIRLWRKTGIRVLPGEYLSRDTDTGNPGKRYIRVAMVAPKAETERGLKMLRDCLYD